MHHMTEFKPDPEVVHLLKLRSGRSSFLSSLLPPILPMNLCYSILLLLLVLSGFSESLQHTKPPDFLHTTRVVCDSSQLGVLAPVLPQNEVYRIIPPHNEVYKPTPPQNEVYKPIMPQNKALTSSEVLKLTPSGVFNYFLPLNRVFQIIATNCQLFNNMKTWGSGPLLRMACASPISFNWFCTITEKIGVSTVVGISMDTLVFLCCFQLQKQENLYKPFEWHSKINSKHTHTPAHLHFPLIIKLLHTPLRLVFSLCNSTND